MNSKSDTKRGKMGRKFTPAALLLVLILMLTLACSGEDPTPAPEADRTQQELLHTIERMGEEMDSLKQEMDESKETRDAEQASDREEETALRPATTPLPTSTPELAVIPTPSGPGICGRSPEVQRVILEDLKINLCRAVTEGELFRIMTLGVDMNTASAGDFQGLVNVGELWISAKNVESGTFAGMKSLKELQLTIKDDGSIATGAFQGLQRLSEMKLGVATNGSIETGAFQGLSNMETLQISLNETPSDEDTFSTPDFDGMPNLKHITTRWFEMKTVASTPFGGLTNLESAEITIGFIDDEPEGKEFKIPGNMFENNPNLKKIQFGIWASGEVKINIPEELFSNNPLLEEIKIDSRRAKLPRNIFKHLEELKQLDLRAYRFAGESQRHKLALHESSPLYIVITLGDKYTEGFELVEEE